MIESTCGGRNSLNYAQKYWCPKTFATPAILLCKLKQPYFSVLYTLLPSSFPYISIAINFFFHGHFFLNASLGGWDVFARRCFCVRNQSQPSRWQRVQWGVLQKWSPLEVQTSRSVVSCGKRGTWWHSNMFHDMSKIVCDKRDTFARFLTNEFHFSRQALQSCRVACFLRIAWSGLCQVVTTCKLHGTAWHFVTYVMKNWRKPRTKHRFEVADLGVHEENSQENVDFVPAKVWTFAEVSYEMVVLSFLHASSRFSSFIVAVVSRGFRRVGVACLLQIPLSELRQCHFAWQVQYLVIF